MAASRGDLELTSLKRGLRALIMLTRRRMMTISEAARQLGLPRTTAERIMVTLEREQFLVRDPDTKLYSLAPRVSALAGAFSSEDRMIHVARPILFDKTREIGWPLAIATSLGDQMSVRITTDPATSLGLHKRHVGSEIAIAASSSGIVLLAFLADAEREEKIAMLAQSRDPAQALARDRRALDGYLAAARRDGYSIGPDLGKERALSVPLFDHGRIRGVLLMMYIARGIPADALQTRFVGELKALATVIETAAFDMSD
ncbi:helix-turn-helix domain-containing protein [Phenylobacterium sp.]|uniref:helix-turn-helix domain-containing protein n=1 Tax=Phenylobacterium sp. TaxID=1871053 RepID=UPI0025CC3C75|nr:helix-turn-helix domain-containing protein [Phenylobacterium sp.]